MIFFVWIWYETCCQNGITVRYMNFCKSNFTPKQVQHNISNFPFSFSLMILSFISDLTNEDDVMISLGWMGNNKVSFETTSFIIILHPIETKESRKEGLETWFTSIICFVCIGFPFNLLPTRSAYYNYYCFQ